MSAPTIAITSDSSQWPMPSRWRRFGVFYLDLWVASTIVHVLGHNLGLEKYGWPLSVALWILLELALHRPLGRSFGRFALGIAKTIDGPRVHPALSAQVHWSLVLFAVIFVMEAHKGVVRGLSSYGFSFFMGMRFEDSASQLQFIVVGALNLTAALALFHLRVYAAPLVLAFKATDLLNHIISWNLLVETARIYKLEREVWSGRSNPFSAESFAGIAVFGELVFLLALAVVLFAFRTRFKNHGMPWANLPDPSPN